LKQKSEARTESGKHERAAPACLLPQCLPRALCINKSQVSNTRRILDSIPTIPHRKHD
jgi:hypothetical protein